MNEINNQPQRGGERGGKTVQIQKGAGEREMWGGKLLNNTREKSEEAEKERKEKNKGKDRDTAHTEVWTL